MNRLSRALISKDQNQEHISDNAAVKIARQILIGYNSSYIRVASYINNRYVYFHPTPDPLRFFSHQEEDSIFSAHYHNEERSIERADQVRTYLVQSLDAVIADLGVNIDNYVTARNRFSGELNNLVNSLYHVKYNTNLEFEKKKHLIKKCRLV